MADRRLIPIYDDTVPVACTITQAEIPERVELLERMRIALSTIERTPTGLVLHFPADAAVRSDLATFVVDEKRCCEFWGFDILDGDDAVALRWDGPPAADELIGRLEKYFTGDEPISLLEGLL